jgi:hypothetical protein
VDQPLSLANALHFLEDEQLSSVEFVQDYVQLRFNGPCLTVYTNAHKVTKDGSSIAWGDTGYRDALCGLITHTVKKVLLKDSESLSITLDDSSVWFISLRDEDYRGPEALMYSDDFRELWFVV